MISKTRTRHPKYYFVEEEDAMEDLMKIMLVIFMRYWIAEKVKVNKNM